MTCARTNAREEPLCSALLHASLLCTTPRYLLYATLSTLLYCAVLHSTLRYSTPRHPPLRYSTVTIPGNEEETRDAIFNSKEFGGKDRSIKRSILISLVE